MRLRSTVPTTLAAAVAWGWFEAGWVRLRELEVELPGLPAELDGLRIAHLSDFHLGSAVARRARGRARRSSGSAERRPDLAAITGDLLTQPRGEPRLRELVGGSECRRSRCSATTTWRSPATRRRVRRTCATSSPATLLRDDGVMLELRGRQVWIAGTAPAHDRSPARRRSTRTRSPARPTCGCSSATSRACSTGSSPEASTSCSPGTCTTARSAFRTRAARSGSPTRPRATCAASTAPTPPSMHVSPGLGHDVRAVPLRRPPGGDRARAADSATLALRVEGQASISTDILARYAADAAGEVVGVRGLSESSIPGRRGGVRVSGEDGGVRVELHLVVDWGASDPRSRTRGAGAGARVPAAHGRRRARVGRRRRRRDRAAAVTTRIAGLTYATLPTAPTVCHECVWWQSREAAGASRSAAGSPDAEEEWGAWGTVYHDDDERLLGSMQYGPASAVSARGRAAGGTAERRRGARHVRVPRGLRRSRG